MCRCAGSRSGAAVATPNASPPRHTPMPQQIQIDGLEYQLRCQQDERRARPRLRCKGVAEIIFLSIGKRIAGALLDLSVCGCCIETSEPAPSIEQPGVEVVFTVNGFTLRLAGVVRNVHHERRAGIEFIDVTQRKAEQIRELVKELVAREQERQRNEANLAQGAA